MITIKVFVDIGKKTYIANELQAFYTSVKKGVVNGAPVKESAISIMQVDSKNISGPDVMVEVNSPYQNGLYLVQLMRKLAFDAGLQDTGVVVTSLSGVHTATPSVVEELV